MPLHYLRNPMYALCLLAAFCVRQHMQNNRIEQPLTKRMSIQTPILINIEESDLLINCLQIIAKRTRQILESIQASIPVSKTVDFEDSLLSSSNIFDSFLFATNNIGIKLLA
ncbi:hypothetical protein HZU73_07614 [Apis mellifera caucasica]|uniref:Uncharacterized protein LOC113219047 n=1 Tax=Apis mellifera TaxID=7460 RepID=A0A7M7MPL5_APIME|nr:uncharacterized protein LOC113219047 [Apis mellifera]KAG6797043.1 hypothetical protein HZU73_07614 [Apis mellifera caucasica]KAG9430831.1 hypothetical protein HZU67_08034 [Apis mellifera carnica]|eukprot:XP_026299148.1 uncharacterized protein LOC113219047 [Apis mellifera]